RASSSACARPKPPPAPVTIATLCFSGSEFNIARYLVVVGDVPMAKPPDGRILKTAIKMSLPWLIQTQGQIKTIVGGGRQPVSSSARIVGLNSNGQATIFIELQVWRSITDGMTPNGVVYQ